MLGSVFLVVTGGEALYADMGHFGRRPIRLAWFALVLPALLLNYFGQGALLLRSPETAENLFYHMAPAWLVTPLVVLATLATIIASQALISGAFSITMQADHLGFLPRLRILHTSETAFGQIYIPTLNWALMAACILVVIGFRSSSNLAAAYGIAVTSTMAITTIIASVVMRKRWHWRIPLIAAVIGFFLVIDLAFLGANLIKIPQGGWFPLLVATAIFIVMITWQQGSQIVFEREQDLEMGLDEFLKHLGAKPPARTAGTAVFMSANENGTPAALLANLKHNGVLHETVLLANVRNRYSAARSAGGTRANHSARRRHLQRRRVLWIHGRAGCAARAFASDAARHLFAKWRLSIFCKSHPRDLDRNAGHGALARAVSMH